MMLQVTVATNCEKAKKEFFTFCSRGRSVVVTEESINTGTSYSVTSE
jgi:hypothetical protein